MTIKNRRARVERAGTKETGYAPGWFALPLGRHVYFPDEAQWFETWTEAMEYATGGPLVSEATA